MFRVRFLSKNYSGFEIFCCSSVQFYLHMFESMFAHAEENKATQDT